MLDINSLYDVCATGYIYRLKEACGHKVFSLEVSGSAKVIKEYKIQAAIELVNKLEASGSAYTYNQYEIVGRVTLTNIFEAQGSIISVEPYNPNAPIIYKRYNELPMKPETRQYLTNSLINLKQEDLSYNPKYWVDNFLTHLPEFGAIPFSPSFNHELDRQRKIVTLVLDKLDPYPKCKDTWGLALVLYEGYPAQVIINRNYTGINEYEPARFIVDELVYKRMIDFIWEMFCTDAVLKAPVYRPDQPPTIIKTTNYTVLDRVIEAL